MESAASGIMAGIHCARAMRGETPLILPETTMIGALSRYISNRSVSDFQPMGASFGLLPALASPIRDKKERYTALAERSLSEIKKIKERIL